jgi:UDP-N-acetylmuramate dehydrogenase
VIRENVPLRELTRFGLGGPARTLWDVATPEQLAVALSTPGPHALIGGGTNLVAPDEGFPGTVLRYTACGLAVDGQRIYVEAGAPLQALVDASIAAGLEGLHTMTGIPGWVGGAVYGNAGAYGHSIDEFIESVRFFDGARLREIGNAECRFRYRESVFKQRKDWIIVGATLRLPRAADPAQTRAEAGRILAMRNAKYPPQMKCAGSIFKNVILAELPEALRRQAPPEVIREGKVPAAYFLEQVGAKGMIAGGIRVADSHANLIYNAGGGTAAELRRLIALLKERVEQQFGILLEEEVQYL